MQTSFDFPLVASLHLLSMTFNTLMFFCFFYGTTTAISLVFYTFDLNPLKKQKFFSKITNLKGKQCLNEWIILHLIVILLNKVRIKMKVKWIDRQSRNGVVIERAFFTTICKQVLISNFDTFPWILALWPTILSLQIHLVPGVLYLCLRPH